MRAKLAALERVETHSDLANCVQTLCRDMFRCPRCRNASSALVKGLAEAIDRNAEHIIWDRDSKKHPHVPGRGKRLRSDKDHRQALMKEVVEKRTAVSRAGFAKVSGACAGGTEHKWCIRELLDLQVCTWLVFSSSGNCHTSVFNPRQSSDTLGQGTEHVTNRKLEL